MIFRINHRLFEFKDIVPWQNNTLHWFGLTDGELWIDAGNDTIYEYSDAALKVYQTASPYNDYYISRFAEDLAEILPFINESVPYEIYNNAEKLGSMLSEWLELHIDNDDDNFIDNEYDILSSFYVNRTLFSSHLVGGPVISFFRHRNTLKLFWNAEHRLENSEYMWRCPKGSCELPYREFTEAVNAFYSEFLKNMDKQTENALNNSRDGVFIDRKQLIKENQNRRNGFFHTISGLQDKTAPECEDNILHLYHKMIQEIQKVK
ncbi:MAG: hypothetical protein IJ446_04715 [Oscillospiraceae bacterium]|nr:hypothetical protein [Oscillospiraceae bacterium]